jgi:hypothetical protein
MELAAREQSIKALLVESVQMVKLNTLPQAAEVVLVLLDKQQMLNLPKQVVTVATALQLQFQVLRSLMVAAVAAQQIKALTAMVELVEVEMLSLTSLLQALLTQAAVVVVMVMTATLVLALARQAVAVS